MGIHASLFSFDYSLLEVRGRGVLILSLVTKVVNSFSCSNELALLCSDGAFTIASYGNIFRLLYINF